MQRRYLIGKWITNKNTLEYYGVWEKINNKDFNYTEFEVIGHDAGTTRFNCGMFNVVFLYKKIYLDQKDRYKLKKYYFNVLNKSNYLANIE